MSSVWVPSSTAIDKCRKKPDMDTDRQKEREKARPMLGPQKLPTKDFTQTWTPVRGSKVALKKVAAAPCQPDICCLTDQLHGCFSPSSGRARVPLPEQLSDARSQEVREADAGRETLTLPNAAPPLLHPFKSAPPFRSQTPRAHWPERKVSLHSL